MRDPLQVPIQMKNVAQYFWQGNRNQVMIILSNPFQLGPPVQLKLLKLSQNCWSPVTVRPLRSTVSVTPSNEGQFWIFKTLHYLYVCLIYHFSDCFRSEWTRSTTWDISLFRCITTCQPTVTRVTNPCGTCSNLLQQSSANVSKSDFSVRYPYIVKETGDEKKENHHQSFVLMSWVCLDAPPNSWTEYMFGIFIWCKYLRKCISFVVG